MGQWFLMDVLDFAEAGVGVLTTRTLRDRDVEEEATGMYLCRVLVVNTPSPAPLPAKSKPRTGKNTYLSSELSGTALG